MSLQPVGSPPVPTPFLEGRSNTPSRGWIVWFQSLVNALQTVLGAVAPTGPANPAQVAGWLPVTQGKETYYVAVYR